ncbi:M16 family metallopeptidase [Belliella marina]|uniref:M16 family metallopeptidase n=1 Tax=Belliella marina TaxID=1644146 RepID=A0ABW4VMJ6_9BACT
MKYSKIIVLLILWLGSSVAVLAQDDEKVPLDKRVRKGKLENGLTYYVQQNPKPEKKVELRLAVNVGSILEDDDQAGLAHFTEHMAFNGSRHFEKNELVSYLQSIGVSFGGDLNAYTGFDETVYILPIPSEDEAILRKGFLVLADWANGILMEEEDIDGERGIIKEEWRTGQGYSQRIRDQFLPVLLHESKYADRLPIGKMEIVENFEYETIRRFYRDWYRPDLMAVIAVGDEDPDKLEALIKEYFEEMENPSNAKPRESFPVPAHKETFVTIATDAEAPGIQIQLYYKHEARPTVTQGDYKEALKRSLYSGMLNQRLDEIRQKPDAPFIYAGTGYGNFVREMDYFSASAAVIPGKIDDGLTALIQENERVAQFGFTEQELERVKKSVLNSAERAAKEMDKAESTSIVGRYVSNFLGGKFAESQDWRYNFYKETLPEITVDEINALAKELVKDENRVVVIIAPDKEKDNLPTEEKVLALFDAVGQVQLSPYEEKLLAEDLITELPVPGKVISQNTINDVDIQELTLSNGAKVFVKVTDFKNDEILISATGKGGTSLYSEEDHLNASNAGVMVNVMGVGDFSPTDLRKVLSGKTVSITPNISTYGQTISGVSSPKDLETAFQLMHLYFTKPRKDLELYEVYKANQKSQLESAQANPDYQFSKQLNKIIANGNPRALGIFDPEDYDKINVDRGLEIFGDRFSNAGNFEFFFTGNIDLDTFVPLLEQYIASLPGDPGKKDDFVDLGIRTPKGKTERIEVGTDEKSQVIMLFSGDTEYDRKKAADIAYLGEILSIKLIENLREEIGGVYGVGARGSMGIQPVGNFSFSIQFPCSPDMVDKLTEAAWSEVKKIQENGPSEEDLNKVKEKRRIAYEENLKRNNFWNSQMSTVRAYDFEWEDILNGKKSIEEVTPERIQAAAKAYLTKENLLEVQKFPAK